MRLQDWSIFFWHSHRLSHASLTPSWQELASKVYVKFASYLLRHDLATRQQGGADGGRTASTHRQTYHLLGRLRENPRSGTTRGCPGHGGGVKGYVAMATRPPRDWTRRTRGWGRASRLVPPMSPHLLALTAARSRPRNGGELPAKLAPLTSSMLVPPTSASQ